MAKQYRSREGEATAVGTKTQLTTLGSESAPGPLLVPKGSSVLESVIVATSGDCAAANDAAAILRLEGPGLHLGPEVLTVGGHGSEGAMGINHTLAKRIPLGVPVTPSNEILVFGEMVGEDVGSIHFQVTLVFA